MPEKKIKEVFVVEENNGESFEDFQWWIAGIFTTNEEAEKHLKKEGFTRKEQVRANGKIDIKYRKQVPWNKNRDYGMYDTYYASIRKYKLEK